MLHISIEFSASSFCLRFGNSVKINYSEQSKPYFEPLTFAKLRCLLKLEYFYFVYIFISINSKKRIFH